jgi:hypothetical protein
MQALLLLQPQLLLQQQALLELHRLLLLLPGRPTSMMDPPMYAESLRDSYGEHAIVYKCWLSARPLVSSCLGGRTPTNCPGTCRTSQRREAERQPQHVAKPVATEVAKTHNSRQDSSTT